MFRERSANHGLLAAAVCLVLLLALVSASRASAAEPAAEGEMVRHPEAELLALRLLNCTRTGGLVRADGTCKGRATGTYSALLKPLRRNDVLSSEVAFRWAGEIARADVCDHAIPGLPELGTRFQTAGFTYTYIGENVACGWGGSVEQMVILTHRSMQAEKASKGWHWRNMKNRKFRGVGIGVASVDGKTRIVYDFYGGVSAPTTFTG